MFKVNFPRFRESAYLESNADVAAGVDAAAFKDAYDHFLRQGIDENREPRLNREALTMRGFVEEFYVSSSGFFAMIGWLGDEGSSPTSWRLFGPDFTVEVPPEAIFRFARHDVEEAYRNGPFDYGFLAFGRTLSKTLLKQPLMLQVHAPASSFQLKAEPTAVSDKRLLDLLLTRFGSCRSHAGVEVGLYRFLGGPSGEALVELFRDHVKASSKSPYVERFRPRPVKRSVVTVLFGDTEPMLLQPLLFRDAGVDFGEWIYVCNSPQDGAAALRLGRLMSDLYDVMITVVVMKDNVGFGAANNTAVTLASSNDIYILNPDVYPLAAQTQPLKHALDRGKLGRQLWGGLLFYDERNLMHSGMYMEHDSFLRCPTYNKSPGAQEGESVGLVRVEHFDKCAPFDEARWTRPVIVPAISGAVMAFQRKHFEAIGGFSTRYIYGHYEDADLSLRWSQDLGPVVIDPDLRLVHLEGQGSKARGEQYHGAKIVNRHLFSLRYNPLFESRPDLMATMTEADFETVSASAQ
jgi:hypothetical protein